MKPIIDTQALAAAAAVLQAAFTREVLPRFATINALLSRIKAKLFTPARAAVDTRPAHCRNIMTLLAHLCDMDDELRLWVLRWLAYPLRNPGAKMRTALVFNGGEDSGKSLFMNFVVAEIYGAVAATMRPRDLYRVFHGRAEGVNLAVVDGEFARWNIAQIKAAMTTDSFTVERKGLPTKVVPNRINFIYVTSSPDFLPADIGNRRFVVIEVPPARQQAFYQAVVHEIAEGGADAFREYLMHGLDMGEFNESTLPPPAVRDGDRRAA
ncbi:primase-helicase family protein [Massilia varians]|uniref:primase-helicase family protein n=1 Tax=Massilia varians TaxID=457921 RepID=UPI0025560C84|nr:VapE domain-containing protein [Massilia varians]MDK6079686.1 VapE family protein [Massilia varians]